MLAEYYAQREDVIPVYLGDSTIPKWDIGKTPSIHLDKPYNTPLYNAPYNPL